MIKDFVKVGVPTRTIDEYTITGRYKYVEDCGRDDFWSAPNWATYEVFYTPYSAARDDESIKYYTNLIEENLDSIEKTTNDFQLLEIVRNMNTKVYWDKRDIDENSNIRKMFEYSYDMFNHMTGGEYYHEDIHLSLPKAMYLNFVDLMIVKQKLDPRISNYESISSKEGSYYRGVIRTMREYLNKNDYELFKKALDFGMPVEQRSEVIKNSINIYQEREQKLKEARKAKADSGIAFLPDWDDDFLFDDEDISLDWDDLKDNGTLNVVIHNTQDDEIEFVEKVESNKYVFTEYYVRKYGFKVEERVGLEIYSVSADEVYQALLKCNLTDFYNRFLISTWIQELDEMSDFDNDFKKKLMTIEPLFNSALNHIWRSSFWFRRMRDYGFENTEEFNEHFVKNGWGLKHALISAMINKIEHEFSSDIDTPESVEYKSTVINMEEFEILANYVIDHEPGCIRIMLNNNNLEEIFDYFVNDGFPINISFNMSLVDICVCES